MAVTKTLEGVAPPDLGGRVESYRRLADVFHEVLSEQSLDALLERIADTLAEIVPYDTLTIYQADDAQQALIPVLARDPLAAKILESRGEFGRGITGWAVEHREAVLANQAHLDPRMVNIPGTPPDPEALISVPLIASGSVKGALNLYRVGKGANFTEEELELAKRFGDAASIALDNAQTRAALEHEAQTDSLTGLYNHRFFQERLRSELTRASRAHDSVTLLMFDIDDFKKLNDVYGHATGDQILAALADMLKTSVRASDVVCRIGGEEFAVILPSNTAGDAAGLARRLTDRLASTQFDPAGEITVSIGISQGPEHGMNPRELVACAEAAMMTAKARGKNRVVLYDDASTERPDSLYSSRRDVRTIAHMKMLQSLAGKLNRLNDVRQIGDAIANELRTLIDYHNCRVYVVEDDTLELIAFRGQSVARRDEMPEAFSFKVGEGITGRAAASARPVIVGNVLECDFAVHFPDTEGVEKSVAAVPLCYGARVIGVVVISKLGIDQFDEDDVRLLEVLAGHASVALENASLYEAQRREAENAKALLKFSEVVANSPSFYAIGDETVDMVARLLDAPQVGLWIGNDRGDQYACAAHAGHAGDATAVAVIRRPIAEDAASPFLEGRKAPFTLAPDDTARLFGIPKDEASRTAIAPLPHADGVTGWIAVTEPAEKLNHHFTEDRLRLLAGLANQAANAMQKALLYKYQKEEAEIANASLEFSRQLATAEDLNQVVNRTVELAARIMGSPRTGVWLQDMETGDVVAEALWGSEADERVGYFNERFDAEVARPLLSADDPFIMKPADYHPIKEGLDERDRDALVAVAPLKLDGGRMGAIVVEAPAYGDYEFSERKMRLLTGIAHQAKLAIDNSCSYENLERTFLSTVESLANALEAKDEYTSSHARSITDMALEVGTELGMDSKALKQLELGALFHDIGKIGIPSQILLKPGPLTDEEREIIETHPELGEKILAPIARLEDVRPIVRHCHEHFDGSGYPDKKVADDIPIESRVILVCDAFHAMTTDRPYRKRLPVDEACARLQRSAGKQFDPQIVEVFLRLMRDNPDWADGH
ncbi:MAG TPA: GAF domain-containing protein [Actinomycetota bacterium]